MKNLFFILSVLHISLLDAQQAVTLNSNEKVIFNAKIFTADALHPYAEAVAIRAGRIMAVGTLEEVKKSVGVDAILIDMNGQVILPGFIDSHSHALSGGIDMMHANLDDMMISVGEIAEFANKVKHDGSGMTKDFLVINGISISTWSHIDELASAFNSGDFMNQPVLLNGSDGHTHWGNKMLMQRAGVDKKFILHLSAERRKYYGTGSDDEPNGFVADSGFREYDLILPEEKIDWDKAGMKALEYNNGYGITAWLDPGAGGIKSVVNNYLEEYAKLAGKNKLSAHVAAVVIADADDDPQKQINKLKSLQKKYNTDPDFQVIGFKIFADGVVEFPTQTAALSQPYTNSGSKGALMYDPKKFTRFVIAADRSGLLVHVHAIGDRAVTQTLNAFEATRKINGNTGIPHTITHLQFVQSSDIPKFNRLHILASVQLMWALGDITTIDIVKPYVAPEIYKWQYPARSLLQSRAILCGASDWPVSSGNPFEAIYEAETRKGKMGVLDSAQCVPRLAMLYAYTINAAKALRMENMIGSVTAGKYADMILVDRDVFTISPEAMHETKVLWTMFKGRLVYQAK